MRFVFQESGALLGKLSVPANFMIINCPEQIFLLFPNVRRNVEGYHFIIYVNRWIYLHLKVSHSIFDYHTFELHMRGMY